MTEQTRFALICPLKRVLMYSHAHSTNTIIQQQQRSSVSAISFYACVLFIVVHAIDSLLYTVAHVAAAVAAATACDVV